MAAFILAATGGGWIALRHYDHQVGRIPLVFPTGDRRPEQARGGTQNILLVGSDSRAGTEGEFGEAVGQRSDTTILAHLDADGSTTLVSFPRDLWVTIPAYTDSAGRGHAGEKAKLNAAFALGGPSLLVRTVESLTKIRIDHYMQIDFIGFQRMTDALGGVTVCVKALPNGSRSNLDDRMSGWHGQVGDNTLSGEQALAFVRQRYGLPEGDLDRIRRQQQFIGAVFRSATSTGTLTNPFKIASLMDAATSSITLDDGTSLADLRLLAIRLRGVDSGGVRFETVPTSPGKIGSQSVLIADPVKLATLLATVSGSGSSAGPGSMTRILAAGTPATWASRTTAISSQAPAGWHVPVRTPAALSAATATAATGSCTY